VGGSDGAVVGPEVGSLEGASDGVTVGLVLGTCDRESSPLAQSFLRPSGWLAYHLPRWAPESA
jgi:hypothetical protein